MLSLTRDWKRSATSARPRAPSRCRRTTRRPTISAIASRPRKLRVASIASCSRCALPTIATSSSHVHVPPPSTPPSSIHPLNHRRHPGTIARATPTHESLRHGRGTVCGRSGLCVAHMDRAHLTLTTARRASAGPRAHAAGSTGSSCAHTNCALWAWAQSQACVQWHRRCT